MEKIKVLLAGIGGYGRNYLNEYLDKESDDYELVGVADPFAASSLRFEELKARSIPIFQNPSEFFAGNRADLTVIASPIHTHYPYVLCAFENGSNVLCEKPITGDLAELDELIAKEKESGLFAAVGFQLCFSKDVLAVKRDILDGLFGKALELKVIRINRRATKYYRRNGWAGKLKFEGRTIFDSPLQNANGHELQNMLFLLGDRMNSCVPVESAEAELWQGRQDIENYDAAATRIRTGSGIDLLFYTAHCVEEIMPEPLGEYRFEKAVIRWGNPLNSGYTARFNDGKEKSYVELRPEGVMQKFYDSLEAVRTGIPPVCTLQTVRSHIVCVNLVQQYPVRKVSAENIVQCATEEGDSYYVVPGMADALFRAYEKSVLPSEMGFDV